LSGPATIHDRLVKALKSIVIAFSEHLQDESKEKKVPVEILCPCWTTELDMAKKILKEDL
jgi:short-subunit dehydrogenase